MVQLSSTREPSRRELNKADKQRRIHRAARELFFSRGYSSVTTVSVWTDKRWSVGTGVLGLASAVIPYATYPFEKSVE